MKVSAVVRLAGILAGCIVLLPAGCSKKEPGRTYNAKEGFSIRFPSDWQVREVAGATAAALSPQEGPDDSFRENVNVVVERVPGGMGLDEYVRQNRQTMDKVITDLREHEGGRVKLGEHDAERLVWSHRMGVMKLKVLTYLLVGNGRGYVVTCTATEDTFDRWQGDFESVAATFRVE